MNYERLAIDGLVLVELGVRGDDRGFFVERFKRSKFEAAGLPTDFAQDNHSRSAPGVLRGLHYQYSPAQGKLVGVTRGRIWDVAVDLRLGSPTFSQSYGCELNDMNGRLLWIPAGFGHGFCVLGEEPADVLYKTTAEYNGECEGGVLWNDPQLAIEWPVDNPQLSQRDLKLPTLAEYRADPPEWPQEASPADLG
jgi:dTDP-4-dehydrorhamnose 3,5-epimerase